PPAPSRRLPEPGRLDAAHDLPRRQFSGSSLETRPATPSLIPLPFYQWTYQLAAARIGSRSKRSQVHIGLYIVTHGQVRFSQHGVAASGVVCPQGVREASQKTLGRHSGDTRETLGRHSGGSWRLLMRVRKLPSFRLAPFITTRERRHEL